jgi:hypothetical protein
MFGLCVVRWDYNIPGMVDAAKSLADLQAKGLIKQVGLTNMNVEAVSSIVDAGVPVANNQVCDPTALARLQATVLCEADLVPDRAAEILLGMMGCLTDTQSALMQLVQYA